MPTPDYIAQDSDAWADDTSVAAGGLQVLDRNTQWLRNERLPVAATSFRLIQSVQADASVLPSWYAVTWMLGQPIRYYAPAALRAPDGTALVGILLSVVVTGEVSLVGLNEADGPVSEEELDERLAGDGADVAVLTSATTTVRLTVPVVPGRWNVLRVAFRSTPDLSDPGSSTLGSDSDLGFWRRDALVGYDAAGIVATPATWVALAEGETVTVNDARPLYTVVAYDGSGGFRYPFFVAETGYRASPPGAAPAFAPGTLYWGDLGACNVASIAVDPNSRQNDQINNARLRWRQGAGQALERMALDVRTAHRGRAPQYGVICDQDDSELPHPSTWRSFEINTLISGGVAPSADHVASWSFRWRDDYGDIASFLECHWSAMLVGSEASDITWEFRISRTNLTVAESVELDSSLTPIDPSAARTARWAWESADRSNVWSTRGYTHIADIGTVWTPSTMRLPTADLVNGDLYFGVLLITATATRERGYVVVDGAAMRLVLS